MVLGAPGPSIALTGIALLLGWRELTGLLSHLGTYWTSPLEIPVEPALTAYPSWLEGWLTWLRLIGWCLGFGFLAGGVCGYWIRSRVERPVNLSVAQQVRLDAGPPALLESNQGARRRGRGVLERGASGEPAAGLLRR